MTLTDLAQFQYPRYHCLLDAFPKIASNEDGILGFNGLQNIYF